jgi:hypothetical protein
VKARERHTELLLAAIRADALADRMDDKNFREYVIELSENLDLPDRRFIVLPGGGDAA